ncbi:MAG: hypothetical protein FP813_03055 [Desulfurivibrio sp.]|nr:hypothetical protein [Desulfurivibrio sp.]MBU3936372.1 hypothetical protein [Pseudomonadota bacterium]
MEIGYIMGDRVVILEEIPENALIKRAIEKKFKQECEIIPYLVKGLNILRSTKYLLIIINEKLSPEDTFQAIAKKQNFILNGIKFIRHDSVNQKTPIIITYNSLSCPSPLENSSYIEGLDDYLGEGASMCLSLQDNFNQQLVRSLSNYL